MKLKRNLALWMFWGFLICLENIKRKKNDNNIFHTVLKRTKMRSSITSIVKIPDFGDAPHGFWISLRFIESLTDELIKGCVMIS